MAYTTYKVIRISEGAISAIFLGASALPLEKIEETLNQEASEGWNVVFQIIENKRTLLFWNRESMVVTLAR